MNCAVCGDACEWLHYGALACAGCKAFFRRTVRLNINYRCKLSGNCAISVHSRNCCRGCRFRKCIEVGMNPTALRFDNPVKQPRRSRENRWSPTDAMRLQILLGSRSSAISSPTAGTGRSLESMMDSESLRRTVSVENSAWGDLTQTEHAVEFRQLPLDLLMRSGTDVNTFCQSVNDATTLTDRNTIVQKPSLASQLIQIIAKARASTFFSFLSEKDQIIALKWYAPQIVLFDAIVDAARMGMDALNFTHPLSRETLTSATDPNDVIIRRIINLTGSQLLPDFELLDLDETEACYLKMLTMWNPELTDDARGKEITRCARANLLGALEKHIDARNLGYETTAFRIAKLLSFLTGVQNLSQDLRQCIQVAIKLKVIVPDELMLLVFEDVKHLSDSIQVVLRAAGKTFTEISPAASSYLPASNGHRLLSPEYFEVYDSPSRPESFKIEIVPSSPNSNSSLYPPRPIVIRRNPAGEVETMEAKDDVEVTATVNNNRLLLPLFQ